MKNHLTFWNSLSPNEKLRLCTKYYVMSSFKEVNNDNYRIEQIYLKENQNGKI